MSNPLFLSYVVFFVGILLIVFSKAIWWIDIGWKVEDARPTRIYFIVVRIFGGLVVLYGIWLLTQLMG